MGSLDPQRPFQAIVAVSENGVIGRAGEIPWHLPEDFKWFRRKTMGQVLIMGRKTYEAIGRPLPGRETVVLTREGRAIPGVTVALKPEDIDPRRDDRIHFICGGAEVYQLMLPRCSDLWLTRVKRMVEGDTLFPPFEASFEPVEVIRDTPEFRIEHWRARDPA